MPHVHILLSLNEQDKIVKATNIDKFVSADFPYIQKDPTLDANVVKHMMHDPYDVLNPNSVCMRDGKCTKDYSKRFNEFKCESLRGYLLYKRCKNGINAKVRGSCLDNRYVVPYNPYLLAKFKCHINVKVQLNTLKFTIQIQYTINALQLKVLNPFIKRSIKAIIVHLLN